MKINIKYIQLLIITFLIISLSSSCGIFKKSIKDDTIKEDVIVNTEIQIKLDSIKSNYSDFNTFYSGFIGKFEENGKSIPLKGIIKIKKDTFIQISIRPVLGIELAKILFTNDSLKFLDKIKNEYIKEDYSFLQKRFGLELNYNIIQSILINQIFAYPKENNINSYNLEIPENQSFFKMFSKVTFSGKIINHELKIAHNIFSVIQNNIMFLDKNSFINISYSNFNKLYNKNFPNNLHIKLSENRINIIMNIEYKNIKLNKTLKSNFIIPLNYKPVKFE